MPNSAVRLLIFGLAAVGLTIVFSACGGGQPTAVSQQVVALDGGTVSLGEDITLRIPAGALAEDTTVTITTATEENPSPDELEAAQSVGPALNIDLGGQELSKPVTIEIAFDPDLLPEDMPEDVVFLAFYDEEAGEWVPVGGQVDQERNVVIIETDHLSWWNPFTWNWEAWIAVLKKTLSLSISDFMEGVALLTEECNESGQDVSVDNTKGNSVIKGCITKSDPSSPGLRVVNLKSFHVGLSPAQGGPGYPKPTILGPGEAARFTASTSDTPPAVVYADFTEESMRWVLVSVVLRFLPLGKTVPAEGIGFVVNSVGQGSEIASLLVDIQRDPLKAAEKFITLIKKDEFIKAFSKAATEFGRTHKGFEFMAKWGEDGIRKVLIAVAAVDVIITVTDFVANYFANNRSEVAFSWAVPKPVVPPPSPAPEPTVSLSCPPISDAAFCEFARSVARAIETRDLERLMSLVAFDPHECLYSEGAGGSCGDAPSGTILECTKYGAWATGAGCLTRDDYRRLASDFEAVYGVDHDYPTQGGLPSILVRTSDADHDQALFVTQSETGLRITETVRFSRGSPIGPGEFIAWP